MAIFSLTIDTSGPAFAPGDVLTEVGGILGVLAAHLRHGHSLEQFGELKAYDGTRVGAWGYHPAPSSR